MTHSAAVDRSRAKVVLAFVGATLLAAAFGSVFMPGPWYQALDKPSWTPPNWLFGPVWTSLYFMIAAAGVLAWNTPAIRVRATRWWAAQMAFNACWSLVFFGLHSPALGLVVIAGMLASIVGFVVVTRRAAPIAAGLFVPYLAWVSFAGALNLAIALAN
ncbi:MAG: TspO/MBR family protein [Lautropia sp.]